jgi:hypothetical protein
MLGALVVLAVSPGAAGAVTPAQLNAARAQVTRAEHQGAAALRRLTAEVFKRPARAADDGAPAVGPSEAQQALAIAMYQAGSEEVPDPVAVAPPSPFGPLMTSDVESHSAACWGHINSVWHHDTAGGAEVENLGVGLAGWCGNGSTITYGSHSFYSYDWAQYPYCHTNDEFNQGWDGSYRWAHARVGDTAGVYTLAVVCVPILGSQHRALRIAANGHWDRYDDWGF